MTIKKTGSDTTSAHNESSLKLASTHEKRKAPYGQRSVTAEDQMSAQPLSKRAKPCDGTERANPYKALLDRGVVDAKDLGLASRVMGFFSWIGGVLSQDASGSAANEARFLRSIKAGDFDTLYFLLEKSPDLIAIDPSCLLMKNCEHLTLVHLVCYFDKPDVLKRMLETHEGRQALLEKDLSGWTPLHHAAKYSELCAHLILNEPLGQQMVCQPDNSGFVPLHYAAKYEHWGVCKRLIEQAPEGLTSKNTLLDTPFHSIIKKYNFACDPQEKGEDLPEHRDAIRPLIDQALDYDTVAEQLCVIDGFVYLDTPHDPVMAAKIAARRQQFAPTFKPVAFDVSATNSVPGATSLNPLPANATTSVAVLDLAGEGASTHTKERESVATEALDLASNDALDDRLDTQARKIVRVLKTVGVYGRANCFSRETKNNFYSMGDENASLQLVHQLVALGTPKIICRLSPLGESVTAGISFEKRQEKQQYSAFRSSEQRKHQVMLSKLAFLLPVFDPEKGLPQTVRLGNSEVTFVNYDDPETNNPLEIGFVEPISRYTETGCLPDNYMNIKPYRFGSRVQSLCTDVEAGGRVNRHLLNLPVNSLLPEHEESTDPVDLIRAGDHKPLQQHFQACGVKDSRLAHNLASVALLMGSGRVSASVAYGLHHPKVAGEQVMTRWVTTLSIRAEHRGFDKPTLILINRGALKKPGLKSALDEMRVPVIHADADGIEDRLKRVAVVVLPSLPKPVFQALLNCSDLPALAEGANTTSHLLVKGRPYLALWPEGDTPVAQEMGYPLEALKAEAFSYKLNMLWEVEEKLAALYELLQKEHYREAVRFLKDSEDELRSMAFLYKEAETDKTTGVALLNFPSLLSRACHGSTGPFEKEALLSAADPSGEGLVRYVERMNDEHSATHDHFAMQRIHVGRSFNNSLVAALNRFATIKRIPL